MSIIKSYFPNLAHYVDFGHAYTFKENGVEVDSFSSKETLPLNSSYLQTPNLPDNCKNSPKKAIRWLLKNGYVPTLKGKEITFSAPYNSASAVLLRTLKGHSNSVCSLTVLPGEILASGSEDKTIKLWNPNTSQLLRTLQGHSSLVTSLAVLPGGILASGSHDKTIKLWNPNTGELLRTLQGHSNGVTSLAVLPGGILASESGDKINLWNPITGELLRTLEGYSNCERSLAVLPGGILASGDNSGSIRLWNISTGELLRTLQGHSSWVNSFAVLPEGILASGSDDKTIKLWNPITGECLRTLKGHSNYVCSLAALPGGILASSGSGDGTIKLWNIITGECLRTLQEHSSRVILAVLPGGILASGSGDNTIKIWKIPSTSSVPINSDQIITLCNQAIQQLKVKILEDDNSIDPSLICPLTHELFINPVIIDDEGHTFERSAILKHLETKNDCPLCRAPIKKEDKQSPKPNRLAKESADKIREKSPIPLLAPNMKDADTAIQYLELGKSFVQKEKYVAALKSYTDAFAYTHRSEDYALLPPLYEQLKEPLKAALAYLHLLKYQLGENKIDLAKATLQSVSRLASSTRAALKIKAMTAAFHHSGGDTSKAYTLYRELAEESKEDAQLYLEQALVCNPDTPEIYDKLAPFYNDTRKVHLYLLAFTHLYSDPHHQKACAFYEKARLLAPDSPLVPLAYLSRLDKQQTPKMVEIYRLLADLLTKQKDPRTAIIFLRKALRGEENQDFKRYISALLELKERLGAERAYLRWSTLARSNPAEVIQEGIAKIGETSPLLERLLTIYSENKNPALKEVMIKLGALYEKDNKSAEALRVYEMAYTKFKDFENGLKLADLLKKNNKSTESFQLYYTLTQDAFFCERYEQAQLGMKKIFELKPVFHQLPEQQKQFLLLAGMIDRLMTQNQELTLKVKSLTQEKEPPQPPTSPLTPLKSSEVPLSVTPSVSLETSKITMIRELKGHSAAVLSLAVTTNGGLASGSIDGSIKCWNLSGECLETKFSGERVTALASSSRSDTDTIPRLISGSVNGTIKTWYRHVDTPAHKIKQGSGLIHCLVQWNDNQIISGSSDTTIQIWNVGTGDGSGPIAKHHYRKLHSHYISSLAVLGHDTLASGSGDNTIILWKLTYNDGKFLRRLEGHSGEVSSLAVVTGEILASGSDDQTIKLWNTSTGLCLGTLKGHSGKVSCLAMLPGVILASGSYDGTIKFWNPSTGDCISTVKAHSGRIYALAVLPDGTLASASEDNTIRVWK